jgi:hypothetical protein
MAVRFMDRKFLQDISPLIKDKLSWDAFVALLEYEEKKTIDRLVGPKEFEELVRINATYTFIQHLKKLREIALDAEHEFTKS